jgi:ribose transport system substrate-binding protein
MKTAYPGITVISSDQYAGPTRDTAKRAAENLLNRFGGDLQGIFCVNESSTAGTLLALQDINRAGKIAFVGFDSSGPFIDALRNGQLHGLVVQNPLNMGYLGVVTMVNHLQGKAVERRIDTGVWMITRDNLDTPQSQELLRPPIERYLD